VRRGDWKLCCYGAYETCELFDLAKDPDEKCNVADDPAHAGIIQAMMPLLFEDGWSKNTARELDDRLNAIGHLENVRAYANALENDPLPVDATDSWPGMALARTWLVKDSCTDGKRKRI